MVRRTEGRLLGRSAKGNNCVPRVVSDAAGGRVRNLGDGTAPSRIPRPRVLAWRTGVAKRAVEQADAADEAGASDGASQLIRSVGRTFGGMGDADRDRARLAARRGLRSRHARLS